MTGWTYPPHRQRLLTCLVWTWLVLLISGLPASSHAQSVGSEDGSIEGSLTVLNVVRWSGSLPQEAGRTTKVLFSLYQDKAGGLPLWSETQTVNISADGLYSVLLGSASTEGLPQALFQGDDARWIEAHSIDPQPLDRLNSEPVAESAATSLPSRSLLAPVPYALKSVDAETLAGRVASDYVTRDELQSLITTDQQTAANAAPVLSMPRSPAAGATNAVPASPIQNVIYSLPTSSQTFVVLPNASNDLAGPINSALNSCLPQGGCKIEIAPLAAPAILSSPVIISKNNVSLVCDSPVAIATSFAHTALSPNGYYYNPIDISGNNVEVAGCALDGTSIGITGLAAIHVWGAMHVKLHGLSITSSVAPQFPALLGIRVEGSSARPSSYVDVSDNAAQVPSIAYSVGDNSQYVTFHDNYSTHSNQCFDFNGSGGGTLADAFGIVFHDNYCVGDFSPSYVESARDVLISNNTFWQDSTAGLPTLRVHNTLTKNAYLHVVVDGNTFVGNNSNTTAAAFFQNVGDWQFINNHVRGYGADGLTVDSTSGTPLDGLIANNQFVDNGQLGASGKYCGIRMHQSTGNNVGYLNITGNAFIDDQGAAATELYPICSDGGQQPFNLLYSGNFNATPNAPSLPKGCVNCSAGTNTGGNGSL